MFLNISAGIGMIGMASPMIQEVFGGYLIGDESLEFNDLTNDQISITAGIASGFVGILSIFNIFGRIFWSTISDYIKRKRTYAILFLSGSLIYAVLPALIHEKNY